MLQLVPPYLGEQVNSPAERKVFRILQKLQMNNAVIIHSLGLPRHESKIYGEIDFAIICELGVACLEIKGGRVSRNNGEWIFTDRYGNENSKTEGPFEQVTGNMFTLRKRIVEKFQNLPKLKNVMFACGVIFPDIEFSHTGISIIPEIIFDSRNCDDEITDYINGIFRYWKDRNKSAKSKDFTLLSTSEISRLRDYLRGDFSFVPSLAKQIDTVDVQLHRLTEDQYELLEACSENDRLIVKGSAGTGKTVLAVEYAKRQALCGNRVLLLVYNKNLAQSLKAHENEMLTIEHFHGLASEYVNIDETTDYFFNEKLPDLFLNVLSAGRIAKYDVLVVDEAQDLLKTSFVLCLDELVKGGLSSGKWCVFYDYAQNIYNDEFEQGLRYINSSSAFKFELRYNCRNTKPIGMINTLLTHFPSAKYLNVDGDSVDFVEYFDDKEYSEKLISLIKMYKHNSVNLSDIVILSPLSYEKSRLMNMHMLKTVCDIITLENDTKSGVYYSTIQGFKGLESKIIIIIDVEFLKSGKSNLLLYTAISRAKVRLHIFCTKDMKKQFDDRIVEGAKKIADEQKVEV